MKSGARSIWLRRELDAKTSFGDLADKDKGFDLIHATDMLQATHRQLEMEYLENNNGQ